MKSYFDMYESKYITKRHARYFCHFHLSNSLDFTLKTTVIAQLYVNKLRVKSGFRTHMTDVCSVLLLGILCTSLKLDAGVWEMFELVQSHHWTKTTIIHYISVAGGATHSYFCELPPQETRGWKNTSLVVHCRYFLNISYIILKSIWINVQIWYKWRNLHQAKLTWLNFKGHVILIHTNQIRFLNKMNISQLRSNYKPLKWVSVVSL